MCRSKTMPIQAVNTAVSPNFKHQNPYYKGKLVSVKRFPDYEERKYEQEASTGKKWGVGIASAFINGLGQAINGDWGKAAGFFFGGIAGGYLGKIVAGKAGKWAVGFGIGIWSIMDAVKSAKTTVTEIVPCSNQTTQQLSVNA